ncbi:hypothetical protein [Halomicrococcus gelatinilyticus]|uniref:hypothetical protein n=1 Tax=Halomicrococcus gelatinilyticus TaxID=1702103 RepID=UPI002E0DDD6A
MSSRSFETVHLSIDTTDAHRIIAAEVDGIRSKRVDGSVEYQVDGGMLIAVLSNDVVDGRGDSKLRYQTSILTPPLAHGEAKAREIYEAVADHRVTK